MIIDEKGVEKLAKSSRISLSQEEASGLVNDLNEILDHVKELGEIKADFGKNGEGNYLKNKVRDDEDETKIGVLPDKLRQSFPDRDGNSLKIPPVF